LEALRGRRRLHRLFVAEGIRQDERIRNILQAATTVGLAFDEVPRLLLDDATAGANHQGVALDAGAFSYSALDELSRALGALLVLDHLQDPQNFGTLLRAAEATGVAGVIIPQDRAVAVTPSVVNASAGAVEHLSIARVPNLARALEHLKAAGRWVVGLDESDDASDLYETEIPTPTVLVVGAEGSGIGPNVLKRCDLRVSLPMRGQVASLNAATAGAIVLFDLVRRARDEVPV
jgi:23S rRNA (guanosine2251-2'-O)-methyltransferase